MNVTVKVLLFAKARELAGKTEDYLNTKSPIEYTHLFDLLVSKYCLQDIKDTIVVSVNCELRNSGDILTLESGDEIALIPPLSGG